MKLAALKLASLAVLLGGVAILMLNFGCPYMQAGVQAVQGGVGGVLGPGALYTIGGAVMVLLGLYAFLPKLPGKARNRSVTARLEHGAVITELDPIQAQLGRVLSEMPEVKSVRVRLTADKERRRVRVNSELVINAGMDIQTRDVQDRVNRYVAEASVELFGLEVIQPVTLHVTGVEIDPKAVSDALRAREAAAALPVLPVVVHEEVRMEPVPMVAEAPEEAEEPAETGEPCCLAEEEHVAPMEAAEEPSPQIAAEEPVEPHDMPALPSLSSLLDETPAQAEEPAEEPAIAEPLEDSALPATFEAFEEPEQTEEKPDQDPWSLQ